MGERLDRLRGAMVLDWGELCEVLEIKRSMLHYLRTGERNPSSDLMRKIIEAERAAGLAPAEQFPTSVKSTSDGFQPLEKQSREELRAILADLANLQQRVERLLGEK